jgi:DUF1016 N-terminal domain
MRSSRKPADASAIRAFPDMTGLSPRNLKYMRAFAAAWPDEPIVQGPLAQITWHHNIALLERLRTGSERLWYARVTVERAGAEPSWFTGSRATSTRPSRSRQTDKKTPLSWLSLIRQDSRCDS